jgi:dTMP kinase
LFVVFEGGEGAGKTTQAALLADWLRERGRGDVVVTYEPGGTVVGQGLRSLLLDRATVGLSARAEALLYAADRAQHVAEVIQPALAAGAVVISDRYIDSTLAYQGVGRILNLGEVEQLCRWASMGLVPNLTVLLDVDPAVGLGRRGGAGDRLEAEPLEFHNRVREGFHALARRDPSRYLVVDGAADPEAVHEKVRHAVEQLLPPAPPPDFSTEPDLPLSVSDR